MNGTSKFDDSPARTTASPARTNAGPARITASPARTSGLIFGTCSWSCEDWRGNFYPAHLGHGHWLEYYARHFQSVEVDSTFYHVPSAHALQHWLDCTPADFVFSCKMPRTITHELRLRDCDHALRGFLEGIAPLSPKLGPILIQLPSYFCRHRDELALKRFLMKLPREYRFAVEFRPCGSDNRQSGSDRPCGSHSGSDWHDPHLIHFFQKYGICWVWNDLSTVADSIRAAFEFVPETTDFLYVRLMGDLSTRYSEAGAQGSLAGSEYGSLRWPRTEALENWAIKVGKHLAGDLRAFLYADNHFEGSAPLTSQRLARQFGIEIALPDPSHNKKMPGPPDFPGQLPLL